MNQSNQNLKMGKLSCVGVGMCLGSHITPLAKSYIENADICFVAVSNKLVEEWISSMNKNSVSLQSYYALGKSRNKTYAEMEERILQEVLEGKTVCCAFYGHPGVFAKAPHEVIKKAKRYGASAVMVPGISAEDTLYADLGIDPGTYGCQHYEASHLIMYHKQLDPSSYLILWQIGLVGDDSLSSFESTNQGLIKLIDTIQLQFGEACDAIIYEARTTALEEPRIEWIKIEQLLGVKLHNYTTLIVLPSKGLERR